MTLTDVLATLDGKAELTGADAIMVRQVIHAPDIDLTEAEADALFKLNADAGAISPEWSALFIEAMADFVVRQQKPEGYVSSPTADWLIASVQRYGRIRADEIEMLIHVVELAEQTPARLSAFVLNLIKQLVLWKLQRQKMLTDLDVERLRRALYANGGEGSIAVSRHEAEALFDINDALQDAAVAPEWTDLFVRAVANAVLFELPWKADASEAAREDAWLRDTQVHPLRRIESVLKDRAGFLGDLKAGFHDLIQIKRDVLDADFTDPVADKREADAVASELSRGAITERITPDEAHWLLGRLGRRGALDANERALVTFLRANATSIDPSLDPVLASLDGPTQAVHPPASASETQSAASESVSDKPVFGHRKSPALSPE